MPAYHTIEMRCCKAILISMRYGQLCSLDENLDFENYDALGPNYSPPVKWSVLKEMLEGRYTCQKVSGNLRSITNSVLSDNKLFCFFKDGKLHSVAVQKKLDNNKDSKYPYKTGAYKRARSPSTDKDGDSFGGYGGGGGYGSSSSNYVGGYHGKSSWDWTK